MEIDRDLDCLGLRGSRSRPDSTTWYKARHPPREDNEISSLLSIFNNSNRRQFSSRSETKLRLG